MLPLVRPHVTTAIPSHICKDGGHAFRSVQRDGGSWRTGDAPGDGRSTQG
jgi:hypothetical protein